MTKESLHAVLFDFGNVLGFFDHLKACNTLAAMTSGVRRGEQIRQSLFAHNGLATMLETGRIDENAFMRSVCRELDILPFDNREEFEEIWGNIFTDAGVSTVLDRIRPAMKVGILSNTDPIHWKYIQRLPVMKAHFSASPFLTTSFEMKVRKPDEKMYAVAAQKFDCRPNEILFLDDLQANVDAAQSFGFHAVRFDARDVSAVENLSHTLSTFGTLTQ